MRVHKEMAIDVVAVNVRELMELERLSLTVLYAINRIPIRDCEATVVFEFATHGDGSGTIRVGVKSDDFGQWQGGECPEGTKASDWARFLSLRVQSLIVAGSKFFISSEIGEDKIDERLTLKRLGR